MSKELKKVRDILLKHKGKGHEIPSWKIADKLGIDEDDTHAQARGLVLKCAKEYHLPVAANSRGYFIMETEAELREYTDDLDKRIKGIKKRKKKMEEYFWEWNG